MSTLRSWLAFRRGQPTLSSGIENFDRVIVDRLGRFRANTVSGTARLHLRSLTSIGATYEYERVEGGPKMGRVTVRLMQSF